MPFKPIFEFYTLDGVYYRIKKNLRTLGTKNIGLLLQIFEKMGIECQENADNFVIL